MSALDGQAALVTGSSRGIGAQRPPGVHRARLVRRGAAVRFYEEPGLARRFGADYQDYRRHVRAWIPRLRPWELRP